MAKTLVYVNKEKIIGLSVPFIGSEIEIVREASASGGFNWLIQGEVSRTRQEGIRIQVRDLLPENIAIKLLEKFPLDLTFDDVDECTKALKEWEHQNNVGKPLRVSGILHLPGLNKSEETNSLNPSTIETTYIMYNGERYLNCELQNDGVALPVYFPEDSLAMASYCNGKNVEVIGILGFAPWYDAGKNRTINSILIGAAIWVK